MCGIAGILNLRQQVNVEELDRFTDSLAHRGPDGRGVFIDGGLGLGHRRLAILDLSDAGRNPMPYGGEDGKRYWITFNGEIYNFLELRSELQTLGHHFRTETDTEVILASYDQWGEECLSRFNGMWAFALWDSVERRLFLARDRFGVKPLYYLAAERFAFASELKAFLQLKAFSVQFNEALVPRILQNSEPWEGATDQTMMKNVRSLPGGHSMVINREGELSIRQWWETRDHVVEEPQRYEEQVERFRELFLDAVRIRMRSDVPVGTCLSGGVDSGAVASSMAWLHEHAYGDLDRCAADWQKTFIATFPGSKLDERKYADEVARHIHADVHYSTFDAEEAARAVTDSVWAVEFVHGIIAVPVWNIYREMRRQRILVSLDGHGGDELLCGYTGYLDWPMNQVNDNLYGDFHRTMLPSILRNYDRCSMAHGIEVRMPLLDWRLVTFAFGLPAESKIGGGFTKRVFRDAMKGIMPESIRTRRSKIGFNAPMIEWFNGSMKTVVQRVLDHRVWLQSPFWDGKSMRSQVLARMQHGPWRYDEWGKVFQLSVMMNIALWQLLFVERSGEEIF